MLIIAIDLGGTRIKVGVVAGARTLAHAALDADAQAGLEPKLPEIESVVRDLCKQASIDARDCRAVGFAFPCLVDPRSQRVTSGVGKYPDAQTLDLCAWAKRTFAAEVVVDNDANAALAGEWQFGAGRGCADCVMLTLGTGIGTSVVMNNRPLRGAHGQAGNQGGHIVLNAFGRKCICGNIGCAETEASSWALPEIVQTLDGFSKSQLAREPVLDYATIFRLADSDPVARKLRDRSIHIWSIAALNLVHSFDPERVILGGGIMRSPEPIISLMQQHIDQNMWTGWGTPRVVASELGDSAALLGMGYLAENR